MATQLTQADLAFFEQHATIGETIKQGWAHGLTKEVKDGFEDIYRRHIDKDFHLQRNCTDCMVRMLTKLFALHATQLKEAKKAEAETEEQKTTRRSSKKEE